MIDARHTTQPTVPTTKKAQSNSATSEGMKARNPVRESIITVTWSMWLTLLYLIAQLP